LHYIKQKVIITTVLKLTENKRKRSKSAKQPCLKLMVIQQVTRLTRENIKERSSWEEIPMHPPSKVTVMISPIVFLIVKIAIKVETLKQPLIT
jgi:inosine-uridine nucleoside N-ribohydrolase